jgi:hypothetical protein
VPEIEKRRKKPLPIEVLVWDGANFPQVDDFAGDDGDGNRNARLFGAGLMVWNDQEGAWLGVTLGHRVVRSTLGELYPMSQLAYEETTEPAYDEGPGSATPRVTLWRPKPAAIEAVQWDRSPEVLAVLEEWGAEPFLMGDALRVWGPRDGYAGALRGDWLVRESNARLPGVARYTPEAFAERFEAAAPDRPEPRLSPAALWEKSGGNRDLYRDLLHRHGHILVPGDEGYDENVPQVPPCGWSPS